MNSLTCFFLFVKFDRIIFVGDFNLNIDVSIAWIQLSISKSINLVQHVRSSTHKNWQIGSVFLILAYLEDMSVCWKVCPFLYAAFIRNVKHFVSLCSEKSYINKVIIVNISSSSSCSIQKDKLSNSSLPIEMLWYVILSIETQFFCTNLLGFFWISGHCKNLTSWFF